MRQNKWGGSGWGDRRRGRQVAIKDIHPGDVLLSQSNQFRARNVAKVTGVGLGFNSFIAHFVDPMDVTKLRAGDDRDFRVWGHEVSGQWFHASRPRSAVFPRRKI
jgi:hypothetical protein